MNLYEAIYNRKSVRKFRMEPLEQELCRKIKKAIENFPGLDVQSRVSLEILDNTNGRQKIRGLWKTEAPYYLLVYCGEERTEIRNAGYVAEQAVLYLTAKGLGTCYLGSAKAGEEVLNGKKRFLAIAFGIPDGKAWRDCAAARRLPLKELCVFKEEVDENMKTILKAARLAPSSMNSQPWRFIVYSDRIYIFSRKDAVPAIRKRGAVKDFNIGVMLSHIMLAAEELWVNMETVTEEQFLKKAYKNGEYICTIIFHK